VAKSSHPKFELPTPTIPWVNQQGFITIHNNCKNLINCLELYSYKLNTEIPDHKYSDICDATRYLIMYLKGSPFTQPSIYIPSQEDLHEFHDLE
jgi:hypothetical protein